MRQAMPGAVLAAALLLTLIATILTYLAARAKDEDRFQGAVQTSVASVESRLHAYVEMLRGTRGFFAASDTVTANRFRIYVRNLELDRDFQGVQGIGYSARLTNAIGGPERHEITLIEPRNPRNLAAMGRNMFEDPVRREAMERARDSGSAALSGKVTLFQEIDPVKQAGFLVYLPIYRRGAPVETLEQRRSALQGFVYSPFRADDFFQSIFTRRGAPKVDLEVYDSQEGRPEQLLHRSSAFLQEAQSPYRFMDRRVLNYAGRNWIASFVPSSRFERSSSIGFVPLVTLGGCVISGLLFALFNAQARGRTDAERISNEVRRSEEALREANRAKDEFLAMLGHELRNPLGAISNALQVMTERKVTDPHLLRARDVVERQVRHQTRLIEDLLDVSRVYSGKISLRTVQVDLNQTVRHAAEGLRWAAEEQDHSLTTQLVPHPVMVDGDPVRLEQIATNLIHNAIKYTPPGGRVDVTVTCSPDEAILRVKDTGVGISSEMLGRIFDVFTQAQISIDRSQGGLGLGLTLVRNLTQMHGGRVHASSPGVGQGSEFVVHLPLSKSEPAVETQPLFTEAELPYNFDPNASTPPKRLRVLIVEDLKDARETLQELLELQGHEVVTASDGVAGLDLLMGESVDLALVDIGLPGLDGYQVATRFRAARPQTTLRLIALTGYGQPEDRLRAQEAGFAAHMVKPIDPEQLNRLLNNETFDRY